MKKIYIASGFFTADTRKYVEKIAKILRADGKEVFVPMEHQIPDGNNMSNALWSKEVFKMDKQAIDDCDAVLMIDYGMNNDSGASWECGYAYGIGKPCYVLAKSQILSIMTVCGSTATIMPDGNIELK